MTNENDRFVDQAGNEVLRFISATRNLSRIGELAQEVVTIAKSGSWRHYRTAVGMNEWREAEFDYFPMACDLGHDDIGRVALHVSDWSTLAQIMDSNADNSRRRPLEVASKEWPSPSHESLVQRAQRLGWTRGATSLKLRPAPLPPIRRIGPMQGASRDYMLRRLAKERPDIYRRVLAGELTSHGGMREAGFVPKLLTIHPEPKRAAEDLKRHFNRTDLEQLVKELQDT